VAIDLELYAGASRRSRRLAGVYAAFRSPWLLSWTKFGKLRSLDGRRPDCHLTREFGRAGRHGRRVYDRVGDKAVGGTERPAAAKSLRVPQ
jgi:hypothetical protein